MNQQSHTHSDATYEDRLLERLRELYLTRTPLPDRGQTPLTLSDFYRFYRYIATEGYGE